MNVLYILSETTPSYGGIGAYTYKIIKGLLKKEADFKAILVTCNQHQQDSFSDYFKHNDRVKVISIFNKESNYLFLRDIRFQFNIIKKIKKIIQTEKIDIIHHQTGHYDLFFIINFLDNIPKIMTSHGDTYTLLEKWKNADLSNVNEQINYFLGKIFYYEEKHLYQKSTKIITVANHVKENLIKYYEIKPEKISTIHNLVYPEEFDFRPGNFIPPYKIGFIGRPYYIKGYQDLLFILNNQNDEKLFEWYLVTDPHKIKQSVSHTDNINFITNIPQSKLSEFYNSLDVIFIPSYSEACPTVLIESMLKGKLCIARDIIGIREIANNCEISFFENIEELNLKKIIQNYKKNSQELIDTLQKNRKSIIEEYGPKKIIRNISNIYQSFNK